MDNKDQEYINLAIKEAYKAYEKGEIPVGAIIVDNATGEILAKAYNTKESKKISINHAEINAIKKASKKRNSWRLDNTTMYVSLEPCPMCMSAIIQSRISSLVYCLNEPQSGACHSLIDLTKFQKSNITVFKVKDDDEYKKILNEFFKLKIRKV